MKAFFPNHTARFDMFLYSGSFIAMQMFFSIFEICNSDSISSIDFQITLFSGIGPIGPLGDIVAPIRLLVPIEDIIAVSISPVLLPTSLDVT